MSELPISVKLLRSNISEMNELGKPGVYKWWAPKEKLLDILDKLNVALPDIESELEKDEIAHQTVYCIYVGQAKNLRDRLKKHIGGNVDKSTLRKSLGAILWNGEKVADLKMKINGFMDELYIEYRQVDELNLDRAESGEIRSHLRILNIEGFNHESFEEYIEEPLSNLRAVLKELKK